MPQTKTKPKTRKSPARETKTVQGAKKQMWAVVLFAAGILLAALTLIPGGKLWLTLHEVMFGLFGWSAYFLAPLAIYIAVIAAMDKPLSSIKAKLWQAMVLIVLISGAIQIFSGLPKLGGSGFRGFMAIMGALYEGGIARDGGGVFSAVLAMPLVGMVDYLGAKIIIMLAIFVFVMLITGSTLLGFFDMLKKPVKVIEETYVTHAEERSNRLEKPAREKPVKPAAPPRFNIDVDIGDDAPPFDIEPAADSGPEAEEEPECPVMQGFGMESPVEYIEAYGEDGAPGIRRPHPLEDDIRRTVPGSGDISKIVDRFMGDESTAPPELADSFSTEENDHVPPPTKVYTLPAVDMLENTRQTAQENSVEVEVNKQKLVDTLKSFGVETRVVGTSSGPSVTRYELQPSAGVKISKITSLADDIALSLAAGGIRIEAPIPNKSAVGIEIPNKNVSIVGIREIIDSRPFRDNPSPITVSLGKDITGNIITADIMKMPHLLVAGATGSGKSVCINSLIVSMLYKSSPEEVKFVMIDPKMVELGIYNGIPHLLIPVVTDPKKAMGALGWAVSEMLKRYDTFKEHQVRDIESYNRLGEKQEELPFMPKIVIIIDELADLMMTAAKEVEDAIMRLAQMARAAGMHLIIATQRPSVSVITGDIKANIPSRIAFAVSSQFDSRTILDMGGAERLLGRGDMLFYPVGASKPMRVQGCFVSDYEVERVVEFVKKSAEASYNQEVVEQIDRYIVPEKGSRKVDDGGGFDEDDDKIMEAIEIVIAAGEASTSMLQRRLRLGYARAGRIIDQLEERGVVGPSEGSKPRQVLITRDQFLEMKFRSEE